MLTLSTLIGAMPMLVLCGLTTVPVAADQRGAELAATTGEQKILFAQAPAILIVIDGQPVYQQLKGTDLQRITNTKPFIVRDSAGIHYLKVLDGWMQAYGLHGTWSVAGVPPPGAEETFEPDREAELDDATAPAVFISETPAELIVTDGPPRYVSMAGSKLEYVENTTANVFKEPTDDELYVLTSSGWFRSWRTDGPWQFVPRSDLPADIAAIPDDSPVWHRAAFNKGAGVVEPER
jgi:hypothetical protein